MIFLKYRPYFKSWNLKINKILGFTEALLHNPCNFSLVLIAIDLWQAAVRMSNRNRFEHSGLSIERQRQLSAKSR